MEAENVDGTALATEVERGLGGHGPAIRREDCDHTLNEVRVACIQQPIEPLTLPEQPDIDACAQLGGDTHQRVNREPVGPPTLDPADD